MKVILGQKDSSRMALLKKAILQIDPKTLMVECETWDRAMIDLLQKKTVDFLIMDLTVLGVAWHQRISQLLTSLGEETKIIITGDNIELSSLVKSYESGLKAYIPREELNENTLYHILSLVMAGRVYVPTLLLDGIIHKAHTKARKERTYILPSGKKLTRRQIEVLSFLKEGLSNKEIAKKMNVTEPTIKLHIHGLFNKLGATNRTQIILFAGKLGFLD